jgi:dihydrofolate synthase/folylpolyglutamate synthase
LKFKNLDEWFDWLFHFKGNQIYLGLERCTEVARRLELLTPSYSVITVGGTNGKGSSVALLESILSAGQYRVACYTSPYLIRYNERIRIAGQDVSDDELCQAFDVVYEASQDVPLTYFEFGTVAALQIFRQHTLDIAILEVGMGGRLDAVNMIDSDIALVTGIGIDHTKYLGKDRESIGFEKAGIFRAKRPAVCSDPNPPQSLIQQAEKLGSSLYYLNRDFHYEKTSDSTWSWHTTDQHYENLPMPRLFGDFQLQNASGVLMVANLLRSQFSLSHSTLHKGLRTVQLNGRFQIIEGEITRIFDVAHNPHGAEVLKNTLKHYPCVGKTHAVVSVLQDKDISGIFRIMKESIAEWHISSLDTQRSASVDYLADILREMAVEQTHIHVYDSIKNAYHSALSNAEKGDRILVFGSFYTVGEILALEQNLIRVER